MTNERHLPAEAASKLAGAKSGPGFNRSCYVVRNHGDGTGTVALDWYEMSIGRDYFSSEVFMRTELNTALQIVRLLNAQLPMRVYAAEVEDWPDEGA
jgi:hypothetical protein